MALNQSGELDRMYKELVLGQPDIKDPRLEVPAYAPKAMEMGLPRNEEILCVGEQCLPYVDMNNLLIKDLDIRDRTYRFQSYTKSFLGTELVDFLILKFALVLPPAHAIPRPCRCSAQDLGRPRSHAPHSLLRRPPVAHRPSLITPGLTPGVLARRKTGRRGARLRRCSTARTCSTMSFTSTPFGTSPSSIACRATPRPCSSTAGGCGPTGSTFP